MASLERIFINTCKDHVKSSDLSFRQYIFLQIRNYSMLKYPLPAWEYKILSNKVCLPSKREIRPVNVPDFPISDQMFGDI